MTRIVAGIWGGRRLRVPQGRQVRPTAERVREAWLSILGPDLPGARVLDLFAGSGALGLEALSRGAREVVLVEKHADSLTALKENILSLGASDRVAVVRNDVFRYLEQLNEGSFDLALADPPFASDAPALLLQAWERVPFSTVLAVEHSPRVVLSGAETRRWGDIAVSFFRRI